ncbi:MAG: hypothetical protein WCF85_17560 [Rhodospirillaceae bacterium]
MTLNIKTPFFGTKPIQQNWVELEGTRISSKHFQSFIIDGLKRKVLTVDAYAANDIVAAMEFSKWQSRQVDAGCRFQRDDDELTLDMSVLYWEALIGQSLFFDSDYFINESNAFCNKIGWYVSSYSIYENNAKITFKGFLGKVRKYVPRYLYYMTALWNKEAVLRDGLLASSRLNPEDGIYYCEYDVFLLNYDIEYIRSVAESMYDISYGSERWVAGNLSLLPIVVFRIDARMLPVERLPFFEEDHGALRCFSYVPPAAIDALMHEDEASADVPNHEDRDDAGEVETLLDKARRLAERLFLGN